MSLRVQGIKMATVERFLPSLSELSSLTHSRRWFAPDVDSGSLTLWGGDYVQKQRTAGSGNCHGHRHSRRSRGRPAQRDERSLACPQHRRLLGGRPHGSGQVSSAASPYVYIGWHGPTINRVGRKKRWARGVGKHRSAHCDLHPHIPPIQCRLGFRRNHKRPSEVDAQCDIRRVYRSRKIRPL